MIVHYDSEQSYSYIGKIEGDANGNFAITRDSEGITGFIQLSTEYYSFYPLSDNRVVMIKDSDNVSLDCGTHDSEGTSSEINFCEPEHDDCAELIDVSAWIHPSAAAVVPSGFGAMAKMQFEAILANSQIINKRVRMSVYQLPFTFPLLGSFFIDDDQHNLLGSSQAAAFKNSGAMDIVVLLTDVKYTNLNGVPIFGTTGHIGADSQDAFAIVEAPFALSGRFTFVHECAHLMGARHNRSSNSGNDDNFDCAHGLRFTGASGVDRRTLMALLGGGRRIPFISNPNVSFDGTPTGLSGNGNTEAYNAKKVNNYFCKAVNFHLLTKTMYAIIVGPRSLCPVESRIYQADITPGATRGMPPFTTTWAYSTTPNGAFTPLIGTGNSVSVSTSLGSPGGRIYLRVLVTGSDGFSYTETFVIEILPNSCSVQGEGEDREMPNAALQPSPLILLPNPVQDILSIISQQNDRLIHQVEIFNTLGQRIEASPYQPHGVSQIQMNLSNLATGVYFTRSRTSQGILQNTFTLQH